MFDGCGFFGIGILITFIYIVPYEKAKKAGRLTSWRKKMVIGHLWIMSFIILAFAVLIGYSFQDCSDRLLSLRWEAVLLVFLALAINPVVIKGIWKVSKLLSVLLPVICSMLPVYYLPFSGFSVSETINLIGLGVMSIFSLGFTIASLAVIAVFLVILLIGLLSLPVVIAL